MIKRLQRRFILIVAVSLFAVEFIMIGLINVFNFSQINSKEEQLLSMLTDNGGSFPEFGKRMEDKAPMEGMEGMEDMAPPEGDEAPPDDKPSSKPDQEKGNEKKKLSWQFTYNEETRYQTRFFSVVYNEGLEPKSIDTGHIAAVTSAEALEYAEEAYASGKTGGYVDEYRYRICDAEGGGLLFVFLDCRDDIATKRSFLLISAGISFLGYVLVCVLVAVFSRRAVRPFIENYEKQKMFINDAAHEIKTPLAIISANTEVIEMLSEPTEWTVSIRNQIERLNGLIGNLLRLAKSDETEKKAFAEFDLTGAFLDTAEPFKTLAETKGLGLTVKAAEGVRMYGEEESIRQVVSILTENAVKYCDGGGEILAELDRSSSGKHCFIRVTNDCAKPPEKPERLFDRFYRDDSSRVRDDGEVRTGYGIGLSIARAVCEEHKGRIGCRVGDGKIIFEARFRAKGE